MKILYGVTGEGLGHTMRARTLAHHLVARGHTVRMAASGRAVSILRGHGLDTVAIDGMRLRYADGALRRGRTLATNARHGASALARNVEVGLTEVLDFDPAAVITDFDSFAYVAGKLLGCPVVSFDHQHVLSRCKHPERVLERLSPGFRATRAVVAAKTPGCAHYVVTSFFFPPLRRRKAGSTTLVGPLIRPELAAARPSRGDHVLVYQTAKGDPRLLPALAAVPSARFVVYGLDRDARLGNVELRRFDEARFIDELASARAVIANGGFTTLAEAVVLGKPVLSVPVRRQAEQELNAAYLEHLGLGTYARRIEPEAIAHFLARDGDSDRARGNPADRAAADDLADTRLLTTASDDLPDARLLTGTADACAAVENALVAAAEEAA